MYYTYILKSLKNSGYYIGQTQDLSARIKYHNAGKSNYTKKFIPWELIAYKEFKTRSEAMKEERKLKNMKSRKRIEEAIKKRNYRVEGVGGSAK